MNDQTTFTLSDDVIAHVAQMLQLAILTGTDIVDNLRIMKLTPDGETLYLETDYKQNSESNIEKMLTEVQNYKENFSFNS